MMVEHKCKFSLVGCDAKYSAKKEVALNKFEEHAIENDCVDT